MKMKNVKFLALITIGLLLVSCHKNPNMDNITSKETTQEKSVITIPEVPLPDEILYPDEPDLSSTQEEPTLTTQEEPIVTTQESDSEHTEEETKEELPAYEVETLEAIMYAIRSLNIRIGPSVDYEKIGSLQTNQEVSVTGKANTGWYQIAFQGGFAYVSDKYLSVEPVPQEIPVVEQAAEKNVVVSNTPEAPSSSYSQQEASAVVTLVNLDRASYGLSELTTTVELTNAAQKRAEEAYSYFSHTRPDGTSCFTVFEQYGVVYQYAGENLAWGQRTADEAEEDWMNSEGHRANILTAEFNHIGVACYIGPDGIKSWVQLFSD